MADCSLGGELQLQPVPDLDQGGGEPCIIASLCAGPGVKRSLSLPRGTVG